MTEQELRELLRRFQEGDEQAGERVMLQLQPLVRAYARRMVFRDGEEDDYIQVGMLGLLKAAQRFDPERGVKFATFAASWVEGEMRLYRRGTMTVFRMSRSLVEQSRRLASCREQLTQSLQREPAVGELARALGISPEEVALVLESSLPLSSLDEEALPGGEGSSDQERALERIILHESLTRLTPLEQRLIALRYFQELTQSEIAARLTLSQRQVSRLEKRALHRLRTYLQPEG